MLVHPKDLVPVDERKGVMYFCFVWSAQVCTLARLGGASSSVLVNTYVH